MTDKLEQEQEKQKESGDSAGAASSRSNRRKLLKGVVAVPVVMTLQSGAALARTSNLIGTAQDLSQAAKQDAGSGEQLVCLEPDLSLDQSSAPPYDLGENPTGHLEPNVKDGQPLSLEDQAGNCKTGGGIIVSTTAFASIEDKITFM